MKDKIIIFLLALALVVGLYTLFTRCQELQEQLKIEKVNSLALQAETDSIKTHSILYRKTIEELENSNDSISTLLKKRLSKARIKPKEVKHLALISSSFHSKDTIVLRDTIFTKTLDTTLHNPWYDIHMKLSEPNTAHLSLDIRSSKVIILKTSKVWLNRPKCWFKRLFKKKDRIVEVIVKDENPYIREDTTRYIEIIP